MTCTSQQIDLVMHQLKRHQFEQLRLSSRVNEGEIYYITDDKPTEQLISAALSDCYKIGSQKFNDDVSAIVSADATYVYQNEIKQDLKIYKVTRAQYETLKTQGLLRDDTYYYITDDPTTESIIDSKLSDYYQKTQTSSAIQLQTEFTKYQPISGLTADYYKKSETSSSLEISGALARKADLSALDNIRLSENITWAELTAKASSSELIPGKMYRITDYVTKVDQLSCRSKEHQFDLIVTAISENELDENAKATIHEGDTYFSAHQYGVADYAPYLTYERVNMEAWDLKYCLYNDTKRFFFADAENGKGVIWWMKDEWDNEAYYDFKNVQFQDIYGNWRYTFDGTDYEEKGLSESYDFSNDCLMVTDAVRSVFGGIRIGRLNECYGNKIGQYIQNSDTYTISLQVLPKNIFKCALTDAPVSEYPFLKYGSCMKNVLGMNCHDNTFGDSCNSNALGNYCCSNTFGDACNSNVLGDGCYSNSLNDDCNRNTFRHNCVSNSIGCWFENNTIGCQCYENSFRDYCYDNTLGEKCSNNEFGDNCCGNTFGDYCTDNKFSTSNNELYSNITVENNICNKIFSDIGIVRNSTTNQYVGKNSDGTVVKKNPFDDYLLSSNLSFNYDSASKYIHLKAFGSDIGTVNCADFIKDGMLSSVQLCGNVLEFKFNTDAGITPISINLSSFVDNYDQKIEYLSNAISTIGEDYLDSNDKTQIYNDLLSPDEVTLYRGPGNKDISLSVGTGTQQYVYTATLSDFYLSSETSSAHEISNALYEKAKLGKYENQQYFLSSSDLSIVKIADDDYYALIAEEKQDDNVVYVLCSNILDARGETVINVAEPILSDDAATKNYVDNAVSGIDLSEYYKKTQTSSAIEISAAFFNHDNRISALSDDISALSSACIDTALSVATDPFKTIQLIKPYSDHPLFVSADVATDMDFSSRFSVDSSVMSSCFAGFTNGIWQQSSSGFGTAFNNNPVEVAFRDILSSRGVITNLSSHFYVRYKWYWVDDNSLKHFSDWYSLALPTNTEVGANARDVASFREFNVLRSEVNPSEQQIGIEQQYDTYYSVQDTVYSVLSGNVPNEGKILLDAYDKSKTYNIEFNTLTGSSDISVQFYIDLGNGPEFYSDMAINHNSFKPGFNYVIKVAHDCLDIQRINGNDVVKYLSENSNSVTLRTWNI